MITVSNSLNFNNNKTTDYNKIILEKNIYFGSGDNQKQLEFKKDGRVFYNGTQIYYGCDEKVACVTCDSCTACNDKCNTCVECLNHCTTCNGCTSCFNCANCNEHCNTCTASCVGCTSCDGGCQKCVGTGCLTCVGCFDFSCENETASHCSTCTGCDGGYGRCETCRTCNGCIDCHAKCYFWDGLIGDCPVEYGQVYLHCNSKHSSQWAKDHCNSGFHIG